MSGVVDLVAMADMFWLVVGGGREHKMPEDDEKDMRYPEKMNHHEGKYFEATNLKQCGHELKRAGRMVERAIWADPLPFHRVHAHSYGGGSRGTF